MLKKRKKRVYCLFPLEKYSARQKKTSFGKKAWIHIFLCENIRLYGKLFETCWIGDPPGSISVLKMRKKTVCCLFPLEKYSARQKKPLLVKRLEYIFCNVKISVYVENLFKNVDKGTLLAQFRCQKCVKRQYAVFFRWKTTLQAQKGLWLQNCLNTHFIIWKEKYVHIFVGKKADRWPIGSISVLKTRKKSVYGLFPQKFLTFSTPDFVCTPQTGLQWYRLTKGGKKLAPI